MRFHGTSLGDPLGISTEILLGFFPEISLGIPPKISTKHAISEVFFSLRFDFFLNFYANSEKITVEISETFLQESLKKS